MTSFSIFRNYNFTELTTEKMIVGGLNITGTILVNGSVMTNNNVVNGNLTVDMNANITGQLQAGSYTFPVQPIGVGGTRPHAIEMLKLSGHTFVFETGGAAQNNFTLPAPGTAIGFQYMFVAGDTAMGTQTIMSNGANISGVIDQDTVTTSHAGAIALEFSGGGVNHTKGDYLFFTCDGTNWYVNGYALLNNIV